MKYRECYEWHDIINDPKNLPDDAGQHCLVTVGHPCPGDEFSVVYYVHNAFYYKGHFNVDRFNERIEPYIVAWTEYPSFYYNKKHYKVLFDRFFQNCKTDNLPSLEDFLYRTLPWESSSFSCGVLYREPSIPGPARPPFLRPAGMGRLPVTFERLILIWR